MTFPWPMSDCFATLTPPFTALDISRGGARPRGPAAMLMTGLRAPATWRATARAR